MALLTVKLNAINGNCVKLHNKNWTQIEFQRRIFLYTGFLSELYIGPI